jgi:hypothetical protein
LLWSSEEGVPMNRVRQYLVGLLLIVAMSGFGVPAIGNSLSSAAVQAHTSTRVAFVASPLRMKPYPVCPGGGSWDC